MEISFRSDTSDTSSADLYGHFCAFIITFIQLEVKVKIQSKSVIPAILKLGAATIFRVTKCPKRVTKFEKEKIGLFYASQKLRF
jgi:hypothetical protein